MAGRTAGRMVLSGSLVLASEHLRSQEQLVLWPLEIESFGPVEMTEPINLVNSHSVIVIYCSTYTWVD